MQPTTAVNQDNQAGTERSLCTLQVVEDALRGLRFGTVTITVHDGEIVQVERTEKKRIAPPR